MTVSLLENVEPATPRTLQHDSATVGYSENMARQHASAVLPDPITAEQRETYVRSRRLHFLLRSAYWSLRHRSLSRGVWVANFEGFSWN